MGTAQLRSFCRQRGRAGLKLGHVAKVNIQTYVLRQCMLEGTRMRTYECALLHEEDEEIQHSQYCKMTSDWGRFKGPLSASEWTFDSAGRSNAVKKRKLRTRGRCARATWK